jgi:hypothetical protein
LFAKLLFLVQTITGDNRRAFTFGRPDDHIINYCLQIMDEEFGPVLLLTDDVGLLNLATSHGIESFDTNEIEKRLIELNYLN